MACIAVLALLHPFLNGVCLIFPLMFVSDIKGVFRPRGSEQIMTGHSSHLGGVISGIGYYYYLYSTLPSVRQNDWVTKLWRGALRWVR